MVQKLPIAEDLQVILDSDDVHLFLKAADYFVALLRRDDIDIIDFIDESCIGLSELYYRSRLLPKISSKYSTSSDYDPSLIEWGYASTIDKVDNLLIFYAINPYPDSETEDSPSIEKKSLSTELLYVFFDVAVCLGHISKGTNETVEQALITFKSSFDRHLGIKCLSVLGAFHYLSLWKSINLKTGSTTLT